jgi:hypothetical protein
MLYTVQGLCETFKEIGKTGRDFSVPVEGKWVLSQEIRKTAKGFSVPVGGKFTKFEEMEKTGEEKGEFEGEKCQMTKFKCQMAHPVILNLIQNPFFFGVDSGSKTGMTVWRE